MKKVYPLIILMLFCMAAKAQYVQKLTSLNYYGSWGLNPTNLTEFNGKLYFFGTENVTYSDYLMMTPDGSAEGITVVKQIDTAKTNSTLNHLTVLNNLLIFNNQSQIWVSDGSSGGTKAIANLYVNSDFVVLNNKVYFGAYTTFTYPINDQLYESDGTAAGTKLVKTINPTGGAYISHMFPYQGKIFFDADDGVNQTQLWITDGTTAGTYMLKRLNPTGESLSTYFFGNNGKVYFNAPDGVHGNQLWSSDGTAAGTTEITTINPTGPLGLNPALLTLCNSKIYFIGYDIGPFSQLWSTDGTTAGTVKVKTDYTPRTYSGFATGALAVFNNKLYISGYDSLTATTQLWVSDGTTAGTIKVTNSHKNFNPEKFYAFQDRLVMTGSDTISGGEEVFASDGTAAGTIRPTPPSTAELMAFYPWTEWVPYNNGLYFTACYTFWSDYQLCRYTQNPSGIVQHETEQLSVYPNPTNGLLKVLLPPSAISAEMEIYNSTGVLVYRSKVTNDINTVDLSNQQPGIYILKMISNIQTITTQKIVKQ